MSTIGLAIVSRSFSRVGRTTCTGSAPIARSSTARIPTPGLIFCSAATTYIQNHTGSLSEGSSDSQPNRWSSPPAPRAHCASNVVLPQPAGALSRVSLRQQPRRQCVEQGGPVNELGPDGRDVQLGGEQNCSRSGFSDAVVAASSRAGHVRTPRIR